MKPRQKFSQGNLPGTTMHEHRRKITSCTTDKAYKIGIHGDVEEIFIGEVFGSLELEQISATLDSSFH